MEIMHLVVPWGAFSSPLYKMNDKSLDIDIFLNLKLKMERAMIWLHVWYMVYRVIFNPFMKKIFVNNNFVILLTFRML